MADLSQHPYVRRLLLQEKHALDEDHYKVLGITRSEKDDRIRAAFFLLSKQFHPDRIPSELRSERDVIHRVEVVFGQLQKAYTVLSDPVQRQRWAQNRLESQRGSSAPRQSAPAQVDSAARPEPTKKVLEGIRIETLLKLISQSVDQLDFKSAKTNLMLAHQIAGNSSAMADLDKSVETLATLHKLLGNLEKSTDMGEEETRKVSAALLQNIDVLATHKTLLPKSFRVAVEHDLNRDLVLELYRRMGLATISEGDYVLAVKFLIKLNRLSVAEETLDAAQGRYGESAALKDLRKQLKGMRGKR